MAAFARDTMTYCRNLPNHCSLASGWTPWGTGTNVGATRRPDRRLPSRDKTGADQGDNGANHRNAAGLPATGATMVKARRNAGVRYSHQRVYSMGLATVGATLMPDDRITFSDNNKFDLQLSQSLIDQRRLADIFEHMDIHKIELKSETWQWEQTGNICIEYQQNGRPSGIAVTEAGCWVHELKREGQTLCYLMFPTERLKELARKAYRDGHHHEGGGDGGRFCNIHIPLSEILK